MLKEIFFQTLNNNDFINLLYNTNNDVDVNIKFITPNSQLPKALISEKEEKITPEQKNTAFIPDIY